MELVKVKVDASNTDNSEICVRVPEGYEIDEANSTFKSIKLRKKQGSLRFSDYDGSFEIYGYCLDGDATRDLVDDDDYSPKVYMNHRTNKEVFATKRDCMSALAMAQISQIMRNDERFGGVVTDEEWMDYSKRKYCIERDGDHLSYPELICRYSFLAFHTLEQRDLFMEENEILVKQFYKL